MSPPSGGGAHCPAHAQSDYSGPASRGFPHAQWHPAPFRSPSRCGGSISPVRRDRFAGARAAAQPATPLLADTPGTDGQVLGIHPHDCARDSVLIIHCSPFPAPPTHTESFLGLHFDHPPQEALAVWRNEVGHVEDAPFHLLQQLAEVVIIKGQSPLGEK